MKFGDFLNDKDYLLSESINDKGIFKAVYMAGHSGAGKTYTLTKIRSGSIAPRIVNVDTYINYFGKNYDPKYYDMSKKLFENQLALYVDSVLPLAIDVTAATTNSVVRRHGILNYFGYDQAMVFVNCSLETALDRARERAKLPPPEGRDVPDEVVINYYNESKKIKGYLRQKFSPFIEVNNDIGELTDEVVLKAFKSMERFYNSPIENKRGQEAVQIMKENGWKYLSDGVFPRNEIKTMTDMWYS